METTQAFTKRLKVTVITFLHTMEHYAVSTKKEGESVYATLGRSLGLILRKESKVQNYGYTLDLSVLRFFKR